MEFLTILKQTGIFLLAGQIILQFRPGQQYEKYVRLLLGLMVLAQLAVPILSLGDPAKMQHFFQLVGDYEEKLMVSEKMIWLENAPGETGSDFAMEGLRQAVEERLEEEFGRRGMVLADLEAEGEILRLWVAKGASDSLVKPVEAVEIGEIGAGEAQTDAEGQRDAQLELEFAQKLGMNGENLEVRRID